MTGVYWTLATAKDKLVTSGDVPPFSMTHASEECHAIHASSYGTPRHLGDAPCGGSYEAVCEVYCE